MMPLTLSCNWSLETIIIELSGKSGLGGKKKGTSFFINK